MKDGPEEAGEPFGHTGVPPPDLNAQEASEIEMR